MIGGHRIRAVAIPVDHTQLRNVALKPASRSRS